MLACSYMRIEKIWGYYINIIVMISRVRIPSIIGIAVRTTTDTGDTFAAPAQALTTPATREKLKKTTWEVYFYNKTNRYNNY